MKRGAINNLIKNFEGRESISRDELFNYFQEKEGELNKSTFAWRIYDLKQQDILRQIKKGWYTLKGKLTYHPVINEATERMAAIFAENYKEARFCVWDINWLNEFTVHQFTKEEYLLETERDLQESVAYTLLDKGFQNIIYDLKGTHFSIVNSVNPIIILPLISRAPVQYLKSKQGHEVATPTLEKLLVDIFNDNRIFHFVQGAEMERIFENAFKRYAVNLTTLFAYAKRRGKEIELREFLRNLFPGMLSNTRE